MNGEALRDENLEITTLEHTIEDNPRMRIADIYEDALIVLCADESVSRRQIAEVYERLEVEGFGNIRLGDRPDCSYN